MCYLTVERFSTGREGLISFCLRDSRDPVHSISECVVLILPSSQTWPGHRTSKFESTFSTRTSDYQHDAASRPTPSSLSCAAAARQSWRPRAAVCRLGLEHIHPPHHEWRYVREFWSDPDRRHRRVHRCGGGGQRGPWKEWIWVYFVSRLVFLSVGLLHRVSRACYYCLCRLLLQVFQQRRDLARYENDF